MYKRTRLSTIKIEIETTGNDVEDVGLYALSRYRDLEDCEDSYFMLFDTNNTWKELARDTLIFTVANALMNETIELYKYNDHEKYFWGLFDNAISSYAFKIPKTYREEDALTSELIHAINYIRKGYGGTADFRSVTKHLIRRLCRSSDDQPKPRTFLIENLKRYAKKYPWLSVDTKGGILNFLQGKKKVHVTKIYLPKILMQMEALNEEHNELRKTNKDYNYFIMGLRSCIDKYFVDQRNL